MDEPRSSLYFIAIVFFILNAFVNLSKESILEVSSSKLEDDSNEGNKKANLILKITANESRFLSQVRMLCVLTGSITAVACVDLFSNSLAKLLSFSTNIAHGISVCLIVVLSSLLILLLGELVPKRIAIRHADNVAYGTCGILSFLIAIISPLESLLYTLSKSIASIFGVKPSDKMEVATEEDILELIDDAKESGNIEETEKEMINNIFELDDRSVGEIMTHRIDMTAIDIEAPITDAVDLAISDGYSRIPVYGGTIDNIKGILYVKDLLSLIGDKSMEKRHIEDFMRPVAFIPESNSCREAFLEFQQKKVQVAIVVDEYGGTAGIVSMEDLIESVMGNIQDEYDNEEDEIEIIDNNTYEFDGSVSLNDIEDILDINIPEESDYDTLGGLIMDILGRIPEENEHPSVVYQDIEFTVIETIEHRIEKVHAKKLSFKEL